MHDHFVAVRAYRTRPGGITQGVVVVALSAASAATPAATASGQGSQHFIDVGRLCRVLLLECSDQRAVAACCGGGGNYFGGRRRACGGL